MRYPVTRLQVPAGARYLSDTPALGLSTATVNCLAGPVAQSLARGSGQAITWGSSLSLAGGPASTMAGACIMP